MRVLVLMSTYNGEKYIREQLDSLLAQTVPVDIFVRDDGSSDLTINILKEYENKVSLSWYAGSNMGPGKSFFDAVLHAPEAEYYAFADQDDFWLPQKIERAIEKLEKIDNKEFPALYCSSFTPTDANLKPLETTAVSSKMPDITLGLALMECIGPGCTYVFNKKALQEFKRFPLEAIDIHDWALYRIVCALDGVVIYDPKSYILYRQHSSNAIGFQRRDLSFWKNRVVRVKKHAKIRSGFARVLVSVYDKNINKQNLKLLVDLIQYPLNLKSMLNLLWLDEIKMSHKMDTLILKLLIMLKLL